MKREEIHVGDILIYAPELKGHRTPPSEVTVIALDRHKGIHVRNKHGTDFYPKPEQLKTLGEHVLAS